MAPLIELPEHRPLHDPVLVMHLAGWTDAGLAGQAATLFLRARWDAQPLATFAADELIDYRARRPIARLASGAIESVAFSDIEVAVGRAGERRDVVLLTGPEPDLRWHHFAGEVLRVCRELGVTEGFGLGAFSAPSLHTDPVSVVGSSVDLELAKRLDVIPIIVELSASIQTVLEERLHRAGVPMLGLWARVPPYLAGGAHPPAALALVRALQRLIDVPIDTTELEAATRDHLQQVEQAIRERPQIAEFVEQVRALVEQGNQEPVPSGDEIAAEFERFLAQQPPEDGGIR